MTKKIALEAEIGDITTDNIIERMLQNKEDECCRKFRGRYSLSQKDIDDNLTKSRAQKWSRWVALAHGIKDGRTKILIYLFIYLFR